MDDQDEYDPEAEEALDVIERMKIKHENEMKRSKQKQIINSKSKK